MVLPSKPENMGEHLLSLVHIEKLGHPIEEIRVRALASIVSKYNLNLVDENNLETTKAIIEKLLDWLNSYGCLEEKKVLSLLNRILKSSSGIKAVSEIGVDTLLEKASAIEKKIGYNCSSEVEDVIKCIKGNYEASQNLTTQNGTGSNSTELFNFNNNAYHSDNNRNITMCKCNKISEKCMLHFVSNGIEKLDINENNMKASKTSKQNSQNNCSNFKIPIFPWQSLIDNDKKVLASVFEGLKYIDNTHSILQSCQFFTEIALRDFPAEIFIQRPLIVRTFIQLIDAVQNETKLPVIMCLIKTAQCLKRNIKLYLKQSVFNKKREFYMIPVCSGDTSNSDERPCDNLFLNFTSVDKDDNLNQNTFVNDYKIKKHQLHVSQFCFEVLMKVLPQLKRKCDQEEANLLILLYYEYLTCVTFNLKPNNNQFSKDLKDKLYSLLVVLCELLQYHKTENKIIYITLLYVVVKFLNSLELTSPKIIHEIIPSILQQELGLSIFDSSLFILFPQLHSGVLKYVEQFAGEREKENITDFKEIKYIFESMKSSITFLKNQNKLKTKMERLKLVYEGLPSLQFHENLDFIQHFVSSCLLKWSKSEMNEKEIKIRERILLMLMSHSNNKLKTCVYKKISQVAEELLGEKEAAAAKYEYPGDKMEFLFQVDILTEFICHGLNSELEEVCNYSSSIMSHLLKSKFIMSDCCWSDFMSALTPCLSLLQCLADKSTTLGRCIIKMFDPDVAKSIELSHLELLKGNIRLLFSKNSLTRDEAISRLFWLLNREDLEHRKLPRMSVLTSLNLSGICASVKPLNYTNIKQSFYDPGKLCNVLEMLNSETLESSLRRSVLSQLNVMLEDTHLHPPFLEQGGLKIVLGILDNSLIESEYRNYPDSVIPIIDILKQISFHNVFICQELSSQVSVFYNVLRSLFLFSSDDSLRRNSVELLCLLLFEDCILRVSSEKSSKYTLSFPEIVVSKMSLPFTTHVHWRNSKHFEPSAKKTLMGKENCSEFIRIYWAVQWIDNLTDVLATKEVDLKNEIDLPGIPDDMKLTYSDVVQLKESNFTHSVKRLLRDIQNATTHEAVYTSIHKLHSYIILYKLDKAINDKSNSVVASDNILSHMLWESTLERFMLIMPGCLKDESLLLLIVNFLQLLFKSFKSDRLVNWTEKLLTDVHKPLFKTLKYLENSGLKARELRLSIIELAQLVINSSKVVEPQKWFSYMELIANHLKLNRKGNEFYNVAYVDWLIGLLVDLTRKCSFSEKPECLKSLITTIMEIIIAFHCTKNSTVTFMGMNIIKNSLFVLNHILSDTQTNIEDWEELWFQALFSVKECREKINYCWLLSLWLMRDPIVRATALQLFVGFSTTAKGCDLLMYQLQVPFKHIWAEGFRILFDENECCIVKEQSCLLLSNLTGHGTKLSSGNFIENLRNINFMQKVFEIVQNYEGGDELTELIIDEKTNTFRGELYTTPALITSLCTLIQNIIFIDSNEIDGILESGLLEYLTRVLGEIPESAVACDRHQYCVDIIKMYISVCKLMTKCATSSKNAYTFMIHSHCTINCFFSMIDYNLFCESSKTIGELKATLWSEIFNFFSSLLLDFGEVEEHNHSAFLILNRCMSDNGVDHFISSIHIALTSESTALRLSVVKFLTNLFAHEVATESTSIRDIFDRKLPEKALELSTTYGSKEFDIPKNDKFNFGVRLADIFLQIYLSCNDCPTHILKTVINEALGSLFTIYEPAQNFCVNQNFAACVVLNLKKICVKLNLENSVSLKKLSEKKKIEPLLRDVENLFRLITNFTYNNEKAQNEIANRYLSVVVHKLWPWCAMRESLQSIALKMLCTFTHNCVQACRSLALSSNFTVMSLKKMPGSMTLLSTIISQIAVEVDSISKNNQSEVLCLCLQLLSNCCSVTECRSLIPKGNIFQCFTKLRWNPKKRPYGEATVEAWFKFLIAFSSHQEGQLAITKNPDVLDIIIGMASTSNSSQRLHTLIILRNICFHQLNRYRMLNSGSFLSLLSDTLNSNRPEEVQEVVFTIWALACNSQKDKMILRSAGFEIKLEAAKRNSVIRKDVENVDLITVVLGILKNK